MCLNSDPFSSTTFLGRRYLLIHVLLNNCLTLADGLSIYSSLPPVTSSMSYIGTWLILNPNHGGVNNRHAGETSIILNYSASCLLLSYRLTIWTYQVHMHCIPWLYFWCILGWQKFINSISCFELFTYIARLSIQLYLRDKAFPVVYISNCFRKFTTTWVVYI